MLQDSPQIDSIWFHPRSLQSLSSSDDRKYFVAGGGDGQAILFDVSLQEGSLTIKHGKSLNKAVVSPDGRFAATAGLDGTAQIWNCPSGTACGQRLLHEGAVLRCAFSPDSNFLATVGSDQNVRIWQVAEEPREVAVLHHSIGLIDCHFNSDASLLLATCTNSSAYVWNLASQEVVRELQHHPSVSAQFSPNGRFVVTANQPGELQAWSTADWKQIYDQPIQHGAEINSLTISADSRRIATTGVDRFARVWDARSGKLVQSYEHQLPLRNLVFSLDGARLATISAETVRVFTTGSDQPITQPLVHGRDVQAAVFDKTGNRIVTASRDNTIRLWNLQRPKSPKVLGANAVVPRSRHLPRWPATCAGDAPTTNLRR